MNGYAAGFFSPVASALSVAVLNQFWEGALIGLIAAGALAAMSRRSAQARYAVACLALTAMLAAFAATFSVALRSAVTAENPASVAADVKVGIVVGPIRLHPPGDDSLPAPLNWWTNVPDRRWQASVVPLHSSWLAAAWLAGAAVITLLSVFQFAAVRRIAASARFGVRDGWQDAFEDFAHELRFNRLVQLGHSAAVEVPTVVGWLAPIVLVPVASGSTLSSDEMRAILAHEMAHVFRNDYIVNIGQKVVEVVLFFHPATWWLSRRIRVEREYCCDDLAIEYTDSALVYARALSQLDMFRAQRHDYAMGADGGSLMNRITRIVGVKPEGRRLSVIGSALLGSTVAMVGMAFVVVGNANAEPGTPSPSAVATAPGPKTTPPANGDAAPDEIVSAARAALDRLVASGTISQSQATTVEQQVAAGRIDDSELVSSGVLTAVQMQAVEDALGQVKRSFAGTDTGTPDQTSKSPKDAQPKNCDVIASKLAHAVQDGKMTQEQSDQQLAGASCPVSAPKP